jgi:acyl-CoA synthetase (AMP-forming)/AMP-acid ligase II
LTDARPIAWRDGGWDRYIYADCYTRIKQAANVLRVLGIGPADVVGVLDWNSKRHFELYWAIRAWAPSCCR